MIFFFLICEIENEFSYCYRAVEERKDLSCLWKLVGDACALTAQLPDRYSQLCVTVWITDSLKDCEGEEDDEDDLIVLVKTNVFEQGIRYVKLRIKIVFLL